MKKTKHQLVKEAITRVLTTVDGTQVKAGVLYDLLKSGLPNAEMSKGSFYSILSRMVDAGDIQRISHGWYELPRRQAPVNTPPCEKMAVARKDTLREELFEIFLDKLELEAQKVHPDPRRIQLLVEMMREMMRC